MHYADHFGNAEKVDAMWETALAHVGRSSFKVSRVDQPAARGGARRMVLMGGGALVEGVDHIDLVTVAPET